jgi:ABC-2 type transport system ATP-binding protein
MQNILTTQGLRKVYRDVVALEGLSLEVERGQVFGLLGPNGSGKTTSLGILLGVLRANSGDFSWFEKGNSDDLRKNIGSLLETPNFYPYLNAIDNLKVVGKIKEVPNLDATIEETLKKVGLYERRTSKFKTFSLGMKQRLALASALLADPDVLVLDEPTNGLDPQGIAEMRLLINEIAQDGKTIIIASHLLDEIEKMCSHVAILKNGKLLKIGTLGEIMTHDRILLVASQEKDQLMGAIAALSAINFIKEEQGELMIAVEEQLTPSDVNRMFAEKGIYLSSLREYKKNLESTFLEIVQ